MMSDDINASWDYAHRLDPRQVILHHGGTTWLNVETNPWPNDKTVANAISIKGSRVRLTKTGRQPCNSGLRPHCWHCVQGAPLLNFNVQGDTPDGVWVYLTFEPKKPCLRKYQGKETLCTRAFHSTWFDIVK